MATDCHLKGRISFKDAGHSILGKRLYQFNKSLIDPATWKDVSLSGGKDCV
jgi:hypothetical protein